VFEYFRLVGGTNTEDTETTENLPTLPTLPTDTRQAGAENYEELNGLVGQRRETHPLLRKGWATPGCSRRSPTDAPCYFEAKVARGAIHGVRNDTGKAPGKGAPLAVVIHEAALNIAEGLR
jgi:hypothetical protein